MDFQLLSVESDAKTKKGSKSGVLTGVLYLAPAKEADGIHEMCGKRTKECTFSCLYGSGMAAVFPSIKAARIRKTLMYINHREMFLAALRSDILLLVQHATERGMTAAVRINGTSDQPQLALQMAHEFPTVQFYDYTKIDRPWERTLSNYHLTFSFSGENLAECMDALAHGINVAVVFATADFPKMFFGRTVINGDANDIRFQDPVGVIVGLKAKGDARKLETGGFVQIGA